MTGVFFNIIEIKGFVTIFDGIVGAITAGLLSYFMNFFSNENFGEGDVKLLMALGLCMGPKDIVAIIFYSCILGGFISVILRVFKIYKRKNEIAFVPFIFITVLIKGLLT